MKYIVSLFWSLLGIVVFTSYSYSDSTKNNNSTGSDYIIHNSLEAKEIDRTPDYKGYYTGIDESFKSANDGKITYEFGEVNTSDQSTVGNFNIGNTDKRTSLKNVGHTTTLETNHGIKPNECIVLDTGSKVNVIILNSIQ